MITASVAITRVVRPPQMRRESMSRPLKSPPRRWPGALPASARGPRRAMSVVMALGSSIGSTGARIARPTTSTIHAIESHAEKPSPFFLRVRTSGPVSTAAISMVPASTGMPCPTASPTSPRIGSPAIGSPPGMSGASGSGTTDPRVEHDVERVDGEVDEHVADGDDRDVALQLHDLTRVDGLVDERADAGDLEDDLDRDRAADERAEVQPRDGQQREARRPQRVAPQDPLVGQTLRPRHGDVVLLQRRDHVAAQQ